MEQIQPSVFEVKLALENRGALLRRPAQEDRIAHLHNMFPKLAEPFFDIFRQFDGFQSGQIDGSSVITIWEIDRVISTASSLDNVRGDHVAFGDFMMDSEYICCSSKSLEKPVFLDESGEMLATSYFEFWRMLCSGELDFN